MRKIIYLCAFLLLGCTDENKIKEKTVSIDTANRDGFEIITFRKNKPVSIKYKEYNPQLTYFIPKNKILNIENTLKNSENNSNLFVKLLVKNIDNKKQEICIEYHYSKSTYKYCYNVVDNKVFPIYSEYHDFYKHEKIKYQQK